MSFRSLYFSICIGIVSLCAIETSHLISHQFFLSDALLHMVILGCFFAIAYGISLLKLDELSHHPSVLLKNLSYQDLTRLEIEIGYEKIRRNNTISS